MVKTILQDFFRKLTGSKEVPPKMLDDLEEDHLRPDISHADRGNPPDVVRIEQLVEDEREDGAITGLTDRSNLRVLPAKKGGSFIDSLEHERGKPMTRQQKLRSLTKQAHRLEKQFQTAA